MRFAGEQLGVSPEEVVLAQALPVGAGRGWAPMSADAAGGAIAPGRSSAAIAPTPPSAGGLRGFLPAAASRAVMGFNALRRGISGGVEGLFDAALPVLDPKLGLIDTAMQKTSGKNLRENWTDGTRGGTRVPPLQF